jgi:uncharacterized protein (DUF927 family)
VFQSETGRFQVLGSAGSLQEWQVQVALPAEHSSRLVLGLCAAFAAPLLKVMGFEGGGFHIRGPSSTGKTTTLMVAGSVWGGGISSWRTTDNGLEGLAVEHCDRLLCLDELSQITPDALGQSAYMLANGQGKTRAAKDGSPRRQVSWRLLFLSAGEISVQDKIREGKGQPRIAAGQEVRIADIPADAGGGLGIFESVPGNLSPGELADQLIAASKRYYGTAGIAFIERLVQDLEGAKARVETIVERFVRKNAGGADGQVQRVARRFGLLAAAGELATEWNILPYDLPWVTECAVQRCFQAWLVARGTTGPSEIERGIAQVRAYFEQYGVSRFELIGEDGAPMVHTRAGFRKGSMRYVLPEAWTEICKGFDAKMIAAELVARGVIETDHESKPKKAKRLPGHKSSIRVYHVDLDRLFEGVEVPRDDEIEF